MASIVEMPKLSDTMEEGGVASWLVEEGGEIEEGESLVEIETDKATMEYSSPYEGVLLKILVKPGESCDLGKPIAVIGEKGEDFDLDELLSASSPKKVESTSEKTPSEPANEEEVQKSGEATSSHKPSSAPKSSGGERTRISPLARKMAEDRGVSVDSLSGSGPNGRIIARDVEQAQRGSGSTQAAVSAAGAVTEEDRTIPLTMMRKTIAKRLLAGKNEAPHFYLTVSADMAAMMKWRKKLNSDPRVAEGELPKISVNDLVMMAAAKALKAHPGVNASWQEDKIIEYGGVHMAMAVALPTGLVTPVIRDAHRLGIREISRQAKSLGAKAKQGELTPEEYTGGSFTISNLGMTKVEEFTAIINPPQAAILAVGRIVPTPWVDAEGELTVSQRMKMTLSCDHRVVDGMVGAKFLETLIEFLEEPLNMLD